MQSCIKLTKAHLSRAYHSFWFMEAWCLSPYIISLYQGVYIDIFHNGDRILYSFVFILIDTPFCPHWAKFKRIFKPKLGQYRYV